MRLVTPDMIDSHWSVDHKWRWHDYEPQEGDIIRRAHPFTKVRTTYPGFALANEPEHVEERWRPGAWIQDGDYGPYAHADGRVDIAIICIAAPKGFPRRILFTRQFTEPGGKKLKRSGLLVKSIAAFRRLCAPHLSYSCGYGLDPESGPMEDAA